jgi:cbb3-type cytochrome oxidase subunit 3|tara:strand:- start:603 stop:869 length:267 start_codon:yes stop_codon:yes gene_type:complete
MLKELKYLLFLFIISLFFFLCLKYYFSDDNKKNSNRSYKLIDETITNYSQNVILLKSDTVDIVEYVEKIIHKNNKNYNFWKLINNNEQ